MTLSSPFLNSPRVPMTTGIVSVSISHMLLISTSRSLYLDNFSVNVGKLQYYFRWNCYVNEQASSFFLLLDNYYHYYCCGAHHQHHHYY